jgi:hypothetical protein
MRHPFLILFVGATALALPLSSCQTNRSVHPDALVVVKDVRIPETEPPISHFARHGYIDYREDVNAEWRRVEIRTPKSGIENGPITDEQAVEAVRFGRKVRVLSQGSGEESRLAVARIEELARCYDDSVYRPWPGPNSNSFIEKILREVDGVSAVLDHNAVGKDHGFRIGPTGGGTGVEIEMTYLGMAIGLREGVEVNFLGLTAGIGFWPPTLKIPALPELPFRPPLAETDSPHGGKKHPSSERDGISIR